MLLYAALVVLVLAVMLGLSHCLGERHRSPATGQPYESGVAPTPMGQGNRSLKYYMVAMLFLIFDVESVFIFSWAPAAGEMGWPGFAAAAVFIGVLFIALFYAVRVGALEWPRTVGERRRGAEGGQTPHAVESQESRSDARLEAGGP